MQERDGAVPGERGGDGVVGRARLEEPVVGAGVVVHVDGVVAEVQRGLDHHPVVDVDEVVVLGEVALRGARTSSRSTCCTP